MGQSPELAPVASVVCNGSLDGSLLPDSTSISVSPILRAWDITYSISSYKGAKWTLSVHYLGRSL